MGHYDEMYARDDKKRHDAWLKRVDEKEEYLKKEIEEKGIARVLAERWTGK